MKTTGPTDLGLDSSDRKEFKGELKSRRDGNLSVRDQLNQNPTAVARVATPTVHVHVPGTQPSHKCFLHVHAVYQ